ncbi:unnamed protein product [Trifolium pratense]|uniref:Uncharacterized protein n=1 Tax=Trifolium pratense TaxID=57577 RepID=A0ACB0KHN2_TRIPR|nr:unnamed protein product [Trifolium pratense]
MSNLPDIAQVFATYVSGVCDGGGESSRGASQHSDRGAFEVMTHRYDKLHADVRSNAMMTKTCYMEYDPMNVSVLSFIFIVVLFFIVPLPIVVFIVQSRGVLPRIYARCIGHVIGNTVILQDTNLNQIQTLLWGGFCKDALPHEQSQLTLIDWIGNTWKECHLRFDDGTKTTCKISGQWSDICKIHHLADGVVVKFGVTEASNNKVIYFKLSPFIGVRTTLHAPSKSGDRKFIHQTQHYFML